MSMNITGVGAPPPGPAAASPASSPKEKQLKRAAQEFEGMLVSTLWKSFQNDPMTATDDADPASDSIRTLGLQAMSTAMAASGGLGLATMVEKQLDPALRHAGASAGPPAAARPLKWMSGTADKGLEIERPEVHGRGMPPKQPGGAA